MAGKVRIGGGGSVHVDREYNKWNKETEADEKGKVGDQVVVSFPGTKNKSVTVTMRKGDTVVVKWSPPSSSNGKKK